MNKPYLSALQVAQALGISKQTLLRYEKKRIFPKPKRNRINKRREYAPLDLEHLKSIMGRK